ESIQYAMCVCVISDTDVQPCTLLRSGVGYTTGFTRPRARRPAVVELFGQDIVRYGDRHRVKSGITGWAQVHGLRGQTSLDERVEWDNYYIAHWSLGLDMKILALTLFALFRNAE